MKWNDRFVWAGDEDSSFTGGGPAAADEALFFSSLFDTPTLPEDNIAEDKKYI